MVVYLNGVPINYKPGIIFKEIYNDDLDVGNLFIPHTDIETIEPLDALFIYDVDKNIAINCFVADVDRDTIVFGENEIYNYSLNLISPTIMLQGIDMPNRKITQPLNGEQKTILDIFEQYIQIYAPYLNISADLENKIKDVIAPELSWNRPTLFEVFNDLLSEVDCVITMKDFSNLSFIDFSKKGDTIDESNIATAKLRQTIENYADKVVVELENAIYKKKFFDYSNTKNVEWQTIKTDEAILTTDNGKLFLSHNIGKIYKIYAKVFVNDIIGTEEVDITNYIVEKTQYDLARSSDRVNVLQGDYKRNRIYYQEGSNVIDGLLFSESTWLPSINSLKAIENIFINASDSTIVEAEIAAGNVDVLKYVFKIEYESQGSIKLSTRKNNNPKHQRALNNNQDTSYVDFLAFAKKQQTLMDRMAEPYVEITARYDNITDINQIPKLGDVYKDNFILSEREYQLYPDENYINFKGKLSKNYALKNLRTSMKRQRRYTSIASDAEALESTHLNEFNFRIEKINRLEDHPLESVFANFREKNGVELVIVRFQFKNGRESQYLGLEPTAYTTDNQVIIKTSMKDNFSVGYILDNDLGGKRLTAKHVPYVDDDGEYNSYRYIFMKDFKIQNLEGNTFDESFWNEGLEQSRNFPIIDSFDQDNIVYSNYFFEKPEFRYKNNPEITNEVYQFSFFEGQDVFVKDEFIKTNPFLKMVDKNYANVFVVYVSFDGTYTGDEKIALGTLESDVGVLSDGNKIYLSTSLSFVNVKSWAICYLDGTILIAVNGNEKEIYVNHEPQEITNYVVMVQTVNPVMTINALISEDITQSLNTVFTVNPAIVIIPSVSETVYQYLNIVNTVNPVMIISPSVNSQILASELIVITVNPVIVIESEITQDAISIEVIDVTVNPVIVVESSITSQNLQTEIINNTVNPVISLNANVTSQVLFAEKIENTVNPVLTLTPSLIEDIYTLIGYTYLYESSNPNAYVYDFAETNSNYYDEYAPASPYTDYVSGDVIRVSDGYPINPQYYWYQVI